MLDASGYGRLAARRKGEKLSTSSYKFVNVYCPACSILLYLVSDDSAGSPSCTVTTGCVCGVCMITNTGNMSDVVTKGENSQFDGASTWRSGSLAVLWICGTVPASAALPEALSSPRLWKGSYQCVNIALLPHTLLFVLFLYEPIINMPTHSSACCSGGPTAVFKHKAPKELGLGSQQNF